MTLRKREAARQETTITKRDALLALVDVQIRRMGAQSAVIGQAVAKHFGVNPTDLECLDLVFQKGTVTAGELSRSTGLSTGAVTAMIDRLVRKGYLTREHDSQDRRRILVNIVMTNAIHVAHLYKPNQRRMMDLWSRFSDHELRTVERFIRESVELAVEFVVEVERMPPSNVSKPAVPSR